MLTRKKINALIDLYRKSQSDKSGNRKFVELVSVTKKQAAQLGKLFNGVDLADYTHSIDESGLRHALKHPDISISDILLIPFIIAEYDKVYPGNKPFTIVYEKEFVDTVVYIEEIRTGRKKLVLKTMYKRKTKARK